MKSFIFLLPLLLLIASCGESLALKFPKDLTNRSSKKTSTTGNTEALKSGTCPTTFLSEYNETYNLCNVSTYEQCDQKVTALQNKYPALNCQTQVRLDGQLYTTTIDNAYLNNLLSLSMSFDP